MSNSDQRVQTMVGIADPSVPGVVLKPSYSKAVAITPSDSAAQSPVPQELLCAATGNLKVTDVGGNVTVFTSVPVGTRIPIRAALVWSTGTSGTWVGLYS